MSKQIKLIVTGGTFDKEYNELKATLDFKNTHIDEILKQGRSRLNTEIETVMMVDSLDMTEEQRVQIAEACKHSSQESIVITHGTDTMVETAKVIQAMQIPGKTIVLTGAMVPYQFGSSDGIFNLASALAYAQSSPSGVYICMNGRLFDADKVAKNKETGIFESR